MEENNLPSKIDIELTEAHSQGVYSNLSVVNHSQGEFVLDCLSLLPGMPKARVVSRVVLSPLHAKKLLAALAENVHRYENAFGQITDHEALPPLPKGQA